MWLSSHGTDSLSGRKKIPDKPFKDWCRGKGVVNIVYQQHNCFLIALIERLILSVSKSISIMKKIVILLLLQSPLWCSAQRFESGDKIVISKPVYQDVYLAGGTITINAPIHGDLIIAGGTININDSVSNDIIIGGGEITLTGHAGDDIRLAGGRLNINQNVTGDVVVTGGQVNLSGNSSVGGSLIAGGGEVTVDGSINGYVRSMAGSFVLNGRVGKDLDARGNDMSINGTIGGDATLSAGEIGVGQNATFAGKVRYWSADPVNFGQSVKSGNAVVDESLRIDNGSGKYLGFASVLGLLWYLGAALVFIILIQFLFGRYIQNSTSSFSGAGAGRSLLYGFLFFILIPVAILVALLTLVGIPLALLMMFLFITVILLATVITSLVLANYINIRYYDNREMWRQVWTAFGIFIVLKLVTLIPVLGWLLMIAAVFLAFGVLIVEFLRIRRERERVAL